VWAWIIAGIAVIFATAVAFVHIYLHIRFNTRNDLRKFVIRILLMVPVCASRAAPAAAGAF
jgi:hypothetical protein